MAGLHLSGPVPRRNPVAIMNSNPKRVILLLLLLVAPIDGMLREIFAPGRWFYWGDIGLLFVLGSLIYRWYHLDSEEIRYQRSTALNLAVIIVGALAFPYYFLHSRGLRRGALAAIVLGLFFGMYLLLQQAGRVVVDLANRA